MGYQAFFLLERAEARTDGVAGLVVDRLAWMDDEAVALNRSLAVFLGFG